LLITKQVFKNEDSSMGYRYLTSDDLNPNFSLFT